MIINIQQPIAVHEQGKRKNQEDSIFPLLGDASFNDRMFIVCDGMGGHEKGEVASNLVCSALSEYITNKISPDSVFSDELFKEALESAYAQLDQIDDGAYKKMGTTLTFLYIHRGGCTLAHIGDSRIYHIRPKEKRILYKSRDHSLVYDLYKSGEITYEEMKTSPQKNVITRAVIPGKDNRVKADITHVTDILPDDYFFLCSDGMLEQMEDGELVKLLSGRGSDKKKQSQLLSATKDNNDNHSAYLIHIGDVLYEDSDENLLNDEADVVWNVSKERIVIESVEDAKADVPPSLSPDPISQRKNHKYKSYLLFVVATVIVALVLFVFGIKRCQQEPQIKESSNWNAPNEKFNGTMSAPIQRSTPVKRSGYQPKRAQPTSKIKKEIQKDEIGNVQYKSNKNQRNTQQQIAPITQQQNTNVPGGELLQKQNTHKHNNLEYQL